jgi:hypothetical protein
MRHSPESPGNSEICSRHNARHFRVATRHAVGVTRPTRQLAIPVFRAQLLATTAPRHFLGGTLLSTQPPAKTKVENGPSGKCKSAMVCNSRSGGQGRHSSPVTMSIMEIYRHATTDGREGRLCAAWIHTSENRRSGGARHVFAACGIVPAHLDSWVAICESMATSKSFEVRKEPLGACQGS